jgi:hypothetical protein
VSVDNFPGTSATTSVTVRKPRKLLPASGTALLWTLRNDRTDAILQTGTSIAESDRLVEVTGLVIPKDPQRVRLEFRVGSASRPGDRNGDGAINGLDVTAMQVNPTDLDGDGAANAADVELLDRYVRRYDCPSDINRNGAVNGADLAQLLAAWGPCAGACPTDVNGDGVVDAVDLGILLSSWGVCP